MNDPAPHFRTIVAVTSTEPTHDAVRRRAAKLARDGGATLILWARDAAPSPLEAPLPTGWSGDGEEEQFGNRLGPNDLAAAGREPLAKQVGELREDGIDAWAWLPEVADADHLATYASDQAADLVLVSAKDEDFIADLDDAARQESAGSGQGPRVEAVPTG
jgi:hypothetical protein